MLSGRTGLTELDLHGNPDLINIQPLLDITELGAGDIVFLQFTSVSCTHVAELRGKLVGVSSDCQ